MDIEILRDIAEQVQHNYEQGYAIGFNLDDHCHYELAYGLKSMLDEATARQSVKSEDNWKELREDFMHNLRGCDTVTVSLNCVGSTDYSTEDIYNMIASLTDNQVVAKSATSEEVAEAIEQMEDALSPRYLESDGEWTGYNEFSTSAIRTAITALKAYRPKPDCESAEKCGDKCCGYGKSEYDDEPIDVCKDCEKQASYGED